MLFFLKSAEKDHLHYWLDADGNVIADLRRPFKTYVAGAYRGKKQAWIGELCLRREKDLRLLASGMTKKDMLKNCGVFLSLLYSTEDTTLVPEELTESLLAFGLMGVITQYQDAARRIIDRANVWAVDYVLPISSTCLIPESLYIKLELENKDLSEKLEEAKEKIFDLTSKLKKKEENLEVKELKKELSDLRVIFAKSEKEARQREEESVKAVRDKVFAEIFTSTGFDERALLRLKAPGNGNALLEID